MSILAKGQRIMNENILESYSHICGHEAIDQLYQLAAPLKKSKIAHVNSTASGGGVAEILTQFIPMTSALGIESYWEVINGNQGFFECTKGMHNALQGKKVLLSSTQLDLFEEVNRQNAEKLKDVLEDADIVFIHDPQPIPLITHFPKRKGKWIWRCHIDASRPDRQVWKYLRSFIELYDAVIFSLEDFAHALSKPMYIIPPSIDPLSDKNRELSEGEIEKVYEQFQLDKNRPIVSQISRFDHFKDPIGVIEAYRFVKKFNPSIQLVLAGGGAADDPEGEAILREVNIAAKDDPDIHILNLPGNAHVTINALQRASDIILQKSIKEGFGLTVTEGLWKGKPVIGGKTGGIRLQVINKQTGFLVNTPEGAAYWIRYLLQHPEESAEIGNRGKEFVREKFLITRHLAEYLSLIYSLLYPASDRIELPSLTKR